MKNEMPESFLQSHVGHAKSMDTLGVYGHKVDWDVDAAATIIDNVFQKLDKNWTLK